MKIAGEPVGAQLGLIGNLTAAGLGRQYSWAAVGVVPHRLPDAGGRRGADHRRWSRTSGMVEGELRAQPGDARVRRRTNQVRFYNRAGYLDYLLDVSAVVLA